MGYSENYVAQVINYLKDKSARSENKKVEKIENVEIREPHDTQLISINIQESNESTTSGNLGAFIAVACNDLEDEHLVVSLLQEVLANNGAIVLGRETTREGLLNNVELEIEATGSRELAAA